MPELPDVEVFKKYMNSTALHKKIDKVKIENTKILEDIKVENLKEKLKGSKFIETIRYGKYLFVQIDNGEFLLIHFGMTGYLKYFKNKDSKPSHERMILEMNNGYNLAFSNQRLLGKINLVDSYKDYIKSHELGPDALKIEKDQFKKLFNQRPAYIKSILMDQSKICGIGNIYSDEICYQMNIHPKTKSDNLEESEVEELYEKMISILEEAIYKKSKDNNLPEDWLIPKRSEGNECPKCKGKIKKIKISGRSSYYCPVCQKKKN